MPLLDQLRVLAARVAQGKRGVDFLVESREPGRAWQSTPLERELVPLGERLRQVLGEPGAWDAAAVTALLEILGMLDGACGQLRCRVLAQGGEHDSVDSAARVFLVACLEQLPGTLAALEQRGEFPLDLVPATVLGTPLTLGTGPAVPVIQRLLDPDLALFRRPALAAWVHLPQPPQRKRRTVKSDPRWDG